MSDRNNVALSWASTISWWIVYPVGMVFWYLALFLLSIFKVLYAPVAFLLQPVIYLGRFILACLVFPFVLAAKLETIYIYLGVAAIVGLFSGVIVRSIYAALRGLLQLDAKPIPESKGRTIKQYRVHRQRQKKDEERAVVSPYSRHLSPGALSPGSVSVSDSGSRRDRRPRNLLAQTIMEEDDSDF